MTTRIAGKDDLIRLFVEGLDSARRSAPDFLRGARRGVGETTAGAFDAVRSASGYAAGRGDYFLKDQFKRNLDQQVPLPEDPSSAYQVGRNVGGDSPFIGGVALLTGGGSLAATAAELGLGLTGDLAARTAEEFGVGEGGQMLADVLASLTPGAAAKGVASTLAAAPLAATTRQASPLVTAPTWRAATKGDIQMGPVGRNLAGLAPNTSRIPLQERVERYLTPDEKARITDNDMIIMDRLLQTAATPNEIVAMAAAGGAKRGWYQASARALVDVFGEDSHRFAALLAATSPQTSVESNLRNTLNIWKNWERAGRPIDADSINRIMADSVEGTKGDKSVMNAWRPNTIRALATDDPQNLKISGPKVNSFALNLRGNLKEVTNDTHMARGLGMRQEDFSQRIQVGDRDAVGNVGTKGAGYMAANILTREAAEIMTRTTGETWTPGEIQETVWSWVKTATDVRKKIKDPKKRRAVLDILEAGELTDDKIRDTPDFATLFGGKNEFHDILEEAGYGSKLEKLHTSHFGEGTEVGESPWRSRALESASERLDRTTRKRNNPRARKLRDREGGTGEDLRQLNQRVGGILRPSGSTGIEPSAFRSRSRSNGTGVLAGQNVQVFTLPKKVKAEYKKLGVPTPSVSRTTDADLFHKSISEAKANNKFGASVYVYDPEEYKDMKLFMTSDGTAGMAIKPDGDIVSVFNNSSGPHKGISPYLMALAIAEGGTKLDAYNIGGGLPRIYGDSGFDVYRRDPWNPQYKPDDWNDELLGTPEVVYMELAPAAGTSDVKSVVTPFPNTQRETPPGLADLVQKEVLQ